MIIDDGYGKAISNNNISKVIYQGVHSNKHMVVTVAMIRTVIVVLLNDQLNN